MAGPRRGSQGNLNSDELPQCSGAWRLAADGWHSGYRKVIVQPPPPLEGWARVRGELGSPGLGGHRDSESCPAGGRLAEVP